MRRAWVAGLLLLAAACSPQIGELERGESGRVVRVYGGDTLELDSGLRVFLAEVDGPIRDAPYANQAYGELEALALHREVQLAYGGTRRWVGRPRDGEQPPREAALAHVFVRSEGGRWFWLQHELVTRGAVFVRPRVDNHARSQRLLAIEQQARAAERGLWGERAYRTLSARAAARAAARAGEDCLSGRAPFRIVEADIAEVRSNEDRTALRAQGASERTPFSIVVFGDALSQWDGADLNSLEGARVRARGPLGVIAGEAQLCVEYGGNLEVVSPGSRRTAPAAR